MTANVRTAIEQLHPRNTGPDFRDVWNNPAELVTCPDCWQIEWWTEDEGRDHGRCRTNYDRTLCQCDETSHYSTSAAQMEDAAMTTITPEANVWDYSGWTITTGFFEGNIFGTDISAIDVAGSIARYRQQLERALTRWYPGAEIEVRHQPGQGVRPQWLQSQVSPREEYPDDELLELRNQVETIADDVWADAACWLVYRPGAQVCEFCGERALDLRPIPVQGEPGQTVALCGRCRSPRA